MQMLFIMARVETECYSFKIRVCKAQLKLSPMSYLLTANFCPNEYFSINQVSYNFEQRFKQLNC